MKLKLTPAIFYLLMVYAIYSPQTFARQSEKTTDPDSQAQKFLDRHQNSWNEMNVPAIDGKVLYDLIIKNGYTRALEVGTSTGHSAIWMAWALSKTGGRLITIEINERRHREAQENFREAGVADLIDARLTDAHELVPQLDGPFDFVFLDADKDWNIRYFKMLAPKLEAGGCIAVHNVLMNWMPGMQEYLDYVNGLPGFQTVIIDSSRSGISATYKK
ncbi:MAG: class I SAM-dependent methyltransferase [Calditrichia bacterium]